MNGPTVPRDLRDITPQWLTLALNGGREPDSASVTGYSAEPIAEGKGYMSRLYRLWLDYDIEFAGRPHSLIVKLPSADPLLKRVYDRLGQNQREVSFYRELAGGVPVQTPRCYFCEKDPATGSTILLLEDMSYARQGDSVAGCSLEEVRACIGQLARFQAEWWGSPLLDRLGWLPSRNDEADTYEELYAGAWQSLLQKAGDAMPARLRGLGDRLAPQVRKIKATLSRPPVTLVHGDYRPDNCFFSTAGGGQSVVVIDWEFCGRGRGPYDVATFVNEAFPPQARRREEMALLREYHSLLEDSGVSRYSFDECLDDYRLSMLELFVFWIVTGGYCSYNGRRAKEYLRNTLNRLDAAIADLPAHWLG